MKQIACLGAVLALAFALTACGGSGSGDSSTSRATEATRVAEVLTTLRSFYRAGLEKNAGRSCSLMSRRFVVALSKAWGAQDCRAALNELFIGFDAKKTAEQRQVMGELTPASVRLSGSTATVSVPGESAVLIREGGKWLVSATHPSNATELTVYSAAQLEDELRESLEKEPGTTLDKAICPRDQPVHVGHTFNCVLEFGSGSRAVIRLEVRNSSGKLRMLRMRPLSADRSGCNEVVEGVQGTVMTETSGLSC